MRVRVGAGWSGVGRRGGQNIGESRHMFPPWAGMYTGWGGAGAAGGGQQKYLDAGGRAAEAPHFSEFYFKNNNGGPFLSGNGKTRLDLSP